MTIFRIRELRKSRKLSLVQLAASAQVSAGMLSQVERGIADPSLETLRQLARVFSVPLFELFADPTHLSEVSVGRHGQHVEIKSPASHVHFSRLSAPGRSLEVLRGSLAPGGVTSSAVRSHQAEECVLVLVGVLELDLGESTVALAPGDSAHYDSRIPHRMVNSGDVAAEFLISVTPPSH